MDLGLADKVAFITGASGGIGRALATAFGGQGCGLVLAGHGRTDELAAWVAAQPFAAHTLIQSFDVTDPAATDRAVDAALARFPRLDLCLANAGAWPVPDAPLASMDVARLRRTVEVNLFGAAYTARAFLAALARTGPRADGQGASLLFTGSTAGRFGERGHSDYALAKAGLQGLVQSLKHEIVDLDPWGRVNLLEPGWTVTHMARPALDQPGTIARVLATMPLRQLGRAQDVAATALYLSSPLLARHVSGQTITVAGGMEGRLRWQPHEIDEAAVRARIRPT